MKHPELISINAGIVQPLVVPGPGGPQTVISGIKKQPTPGPTRLGILGLESDEQADLTVHGGQDKALYAYPSEHWDFWRNDPTLSNGLTDRATRAGGFGENLTIRGLLENQVYLGDTWTIGEVILQVTAPREPCYKLNAVLGNRLAAKRMRQTARCGWYLRVVVPGILHPNSVILVDPGQRTTSIEAAMKHLNRPSDLA